MCSAVSGITTFSIIVWITSLNCDQVRRGGRVSNDEILNFAKLFNDELTLDNMNRLGIPLVYVYIHSHNYTSD